MKAMRSERKSDRIAQRVRLLSRHSPSYPSMLIATGSRHLVDAPVTFRPDCVPSEFDCGPSLETTFCRLLAYSPLDKSIIVFPRPLERKVRRYVLALDA